MGQYLFLRFTSGSSTPAASFTGFTLNVTSIGSYYMTSSCPGPAVISAAEYGLLSLTSAASYNNDMDCAVVVYSGSSALAVQLELYTFNTWPDTDVLTIRDGDDGTAPVIAQRSGSGGQHPRYGRVCPGCTGKLIRVSAGEKRTGRGGQADVESGQ